jgi:hypothetical protein
MWRCQRKSAALLLTSGSHRCRSIQVSAALLGHRRHPRALMAACLLAIAAVATAPVARAGDREPTCRELWYERNSIMAQFGYCFQTQRARAVFGPRCYPPYGQLPADYARQVEMIRNWERRKGCG